MAPYTTTFGAGFLPPKDIPRDLEEARAMVAFAADLVRDGYAAQTLARTCLGVEVVVFRETGPQTYTGYRLLVPDAMVIELAPDPAAAREVVALAQRSSAELGRALRALLPLPEVPPPVAEAPAPEPARGAPVLRKGRRT